jgi:hypothetical protein
VKVNLEDFRIVPGPTWRLSMGTWESEHTGDDYMGGLRSLSPRDEHKGGALAADDKKNARLIVAEAIVETLKGMKMSYPRPGSARRKALESVRSTLANEES